MDGNLNKSSWMVEGDGFGVAEERVRLELRLGPPVDHQEWWLAMKEKREALLTPGCGKPCYPPPPPSHAFASQNVANNSSQTRVTSTSIVGWPPIRSYKKNLASTSKPSLESQKVGFAATSKVEHGWKRLFVKINMDGVPIGRKVDLKSYDSYEKLSFVVNELFRGLLAAQRDHHAARNQRNVDPKQAIAGLLGGTGEYTLVYEDDEGDRILVGDVPWDMFVSTAKRLRVLKSSELSASYLGANSRKRTATDCRVAWNE